MAENLVDIAGVLGFVLSLFLAISKAVSNRLWISAGEMILIDAIPKAPSSLFLLVMLTNRISVPFTLVNVFVRDKKSKIDVPVEKTVRTYTCHPSDGRLAVKPVVLSQEFPARFEPYAAKVFLLELSRQRISTPHLLQGAPARSQEGLPLPLRLLYKLYTHRLPLRLVLNTSRGRRAIPIAVSSVQNWDFLESYAVQKAAYEEKIVFPE